MISTGSTTLLKVVFERLRGTIVNDEVKILELHSHTKSHCCEHDSNNTIRLPKTPHDHCFLCSSVHEWNIPNTLLSLICSAPGGWYPASLRVYLKCSYKFSHTFSD